MSSTVIIFPVSSVQTDGYPDIKMNVKFVQDTSKFWYKPDISREQGETRRYFKQPIVVNLLTVK